MGKQEFITQKQFKEADKIFEKYKNNTDIVLNENEYIVVHIDGIKFTSKYLKNLPNDFKEKVFNVLVDTAIKLCNEIKSVKVSYVCSDEISLLLDGKNIADNYNNRIQKITSIISSIATATFYKELSKLDDKNNVLNELKNRSFFAVKCFNIPESLVNDYFQVRLMGCKKYIFDCRKNFNEQPDWKKFGALITKEEEWRKKIVDFQTMQLTRTSQNGYFNLVTNE